jgi:hypothetical protein
LDDALQPRRVHLNLKDVPLDRAVAALARQTDLPLTCSAASGKTVTLRLDDVPAWEALDRLRHVAGLNCTRTWNGTAASLNLADGPAAKENAVAYSGPVRLEVTHTDAGVSIDPRNTRTRTLQLNLAVQVSPSNPVLAVQVSRVVAAEDADGHSLTPNIPAKSPYVERGWGSGGWSQRLALKSPNRLGGSLKVLRGELPVEVMVDRRDRATLVGPIPGAGRTASVAAGGWLTAKSFATPRGASFSIALSTRGLWNFDPTHWSFELIDGQGRHHRPLPFQLTVAPRLPQGEPEDLMLLGITAGHLPWVSLAEYAAARRPGTHLAGSVTFPGVAAGDERAKLVFYSYRRLRTTLPFEFHNLPLP